MAAQIISLGRIPRIYAGAIMQAVAVPKETRFAQGEWDEMGAWGRAARILAVMAVRGMSKTELAAHLGVSFNAVTSWTMGEKDPDWSRWVSITTVAGLTALWQPPPDVLASVERELAKRRPDLRSSPRQPVRKTQRGEERSEGPPKKKRARP